MALNSGATCGLNYADSGAGNVVREQFDLSIAYANQSFTEALGFIKDLQNFSVNGVPVTVSFPAIADVPDIQLPEEPAEPTISFDFDEQPPTIQGLEDVSSINPGTVPRFTGREPSLNLPSPPAALNAQPPPDPPPAAAVTIPTFAGLDLPDPPTVPTFNIPAVPDPVFPEFDVERPDFTDPGLVFDDKNVKADALAAYQCFFDRTRELLAPYSVLTTVQSRLSTMLAGGTGLPLEVETALFDRAAVREDISSAVALGAANEDWAAAGYELPNVVVLARRDEIDRQNRARRAELNRDVFIRAQEVELENLRFSVERGITLEGTLLGHANSLVESSVSLVRATFDVLIAVFNAKVELLRLRRDVYLADIEVFKSRIEIEIAKLQAWKTRLEGEQIRADIARTEAEIYRTQVQALTATVDAFRAEVEAARAAIEADGAIVERFKARIQAFGEQVRAKEAEYRGYAAQVEAETSKASMFEAVVRAYGERVRAYSAGLEAEALPERLKIEVNNQRVNQFQAEITRYRAELDAEAARVRAGVELFDGQSRIFTAKTGAEAERFRALVEKLRTQLAEGVARSDIQLKQADLDINQIQRALALELQAIQAGAQTTSQLAAAALAAVNTSAGISHGTSASVGNDCSTNISILE